MSVLLIAFFSALAFVVAYNTYGRWLGQKIFRLSASAICPSARFEDGADFVPTSAPVVFGHHFTSIAGTGPIVGPAIAIMWGWLPALLWVLLGSIFIGAVHDLGSLVVSLRNNGQTVGDIAGRLLNKRVRLLFMLVLFLALTVVLAIFGLVIAAVFRQYPSAIFPCTIQIPIALAIGAWLHRNGTSLLLPSVIALSLMYLSVWFGDMQMFGIHHINEVMAGWSNWTWVVLLLLYSYIASILPVWRLLQPRDYINSLQLISALGLVVMGLVAAAFLGGAPVAGERHSLSIVAPMVNWSPSGAPAIFPFLFVTIACGAISGFHCLVSSGTSSKQLRSETDARFVGYGSMLTEGFLAVIVILACAAGLGLGARTPDGTVLFGVEAFASRYASWGAAGSLAAKVGAFVDGSGNFLAALGIPAQVATSLMGVMVASFAATTLDTACRLQRYVIQELARIAPERSGSLIADILSPIRGKHGATIFAVSIAAILAAVPPTGQPWGWETAGKGGMLLWPLFGATNQLLGGLAFLVIGFYLWRRNLPIWFMVIPMFFMLIMPLWAMTWQLAIGEEAGQPSWIAKGDWLLSSIAGATIALEIWMIVEAIRLFPKVKGVLETRAAAEAEAEFQQPPVATEGI